MAITKSRRTDFTGSHLAPETKEALRKKALREKKSVSAMISEAVEEKLERDAIEKEEDVNKTESTEAAIK